MTVWVKRGSSSTVAKLEWAAEFVILHVTYLHLFTYANPFHPCPYLTVYAMSDDTNNTTAGGRSLRGGASEPLPNSWSQPSERPRVGRIGDWSSRYSVL